MVEQTEQPMWKQLFQLSPDSRVSLQRQLRKALVDAILNGHIPLDRPLPSSRELAKQLGNITNLQEIFVIVIFDFLIHINLYPGMTCLNK